MHKEKFNAILQDSYLKIESYYKMLAEKNYTASAIQVVKSYADGLKKSLSLDYCSLSQDLQESVKKNFKDLIEKCDQTIKNAVDKANLYQKIKAISNDTFYNDSLLNPLNGKNKH